MPQTLRAVGYVPPGQLGKIPFDLAILPHDERRVRRRRIELVHGDSVLVDFPEPITLESHSALKLEDGRLAEIVAGEELLYDVRGTDRIHLMRLCWHLGNRHLKTQIENDRVLILRDHVIRDMLRGLGASVTDVSEPFFPEEGAYSHSHGDPVHALLNR